MQCTHGELFDGLVQDCGISSALTLEIPQFCTKPSILWVINKDTKTGASAYDIDKYFMSMV